MVKMRGTQILILQNLEGLLFCVKNVCSHEDKPLHKGSWNCEKNTLECPAHKAVFQMLDNAKPTTPPAVLPLETYPVKVENDTVFVFLN
jgi:3-phenylpropionate/trans-cinnamate dioxygenase ferredoxin component